MGTPDKGVTTRPTDLLPGKRTHNTPRYPTAAACLNPFREGPSGQLPLTVYKQEPSPASI